MCLAEATGTFLISVVRSPQLAGWAPGFPGRGTDFIVKFLAT